MSLLGLGRGYGTGHQGASAWVGSCTMGGMLPPAVLVLCFFASCRGGMLAGSSALLLSEPVLVFVASLLLPGSGVLGRPSVWGALKRGWGQRADVESWYPVGGSAVQGTHLRVVITQTQPPTCGHTTNIPTRTTSYFPTTSSLQSSSQPQSWPTAPAPAHPTPRAEE